MNTDYISFEDFIDIKEAINFSRTKLENINEGNRLSDHIAPLDESSFKIYESLTEEEKYETDNVMWEAILYYATTDDINEGFFKNVISGVSSMSKKALKYAKTVISNIGQLFKDLGKYVIDVFTAGAEKGKEFGKKVYNDIKSKLDKKTMKKKADPKALKKDFKDLEDTVKWITDVSIGNLIRKDGDDAGEAIQAAAKENPEEAKKLDQLITKELKGKQSEKKNETELIKLSIINGINEMRKNDSFDFAELVETADAYTQLNESDPDESPEDAAEDRKKGLMKKVAGGLKKIIGILTSGIVKLYEWIAEWALKKGFKTLSTFVSNLGGPGSFEFPAIAALITVASAMMLEFGMPLLKDMIGAGTVDAIVHALHASNPAHILSHAAEHAGMSGLAPVINGAAIAIVVLLSVEHLMHAVKGHDEKH